MVGCDRDDPQRVKVGVLGESAFRAKLVLNKHELAVTIRFRVLGACVGKQRDIGVFSTWDQKRVSAALGVPFLTFVLK